MGFIFVLDVSPSMMGFSDNRTNSKEYITPYQRSCCLLGKLITEGRKLHQYDSFKVYRGNKLQELSDDLMPSLTNTTDLKNMLHLGSLFRSIELGGCTSDDNIVVFTDARSFKADLTHYPPCRTRFVIVQPDKFLIDHGRLAEFEQISRSSVTAAAKQFCEPMLSHTFRDHELIQHLANDLFLPPSYTLSMGYLSQSFRLSPPCSSLPSSSVMMVGFAKSLNMMNAPVDSHWRIVAAPLSSRKKKRGGQRTTFSKLGAGNKEDDKILKKIRIRIAGREDPAPTDSKRGRAGKRKLSEDISKKKQQNDVNGQDQLQVGIAETSSGNGESHNKRPVLRILAQALHMEASVAICRFSSGQFAAISPVFRDDKKIALIMNLLPSQFVSEFQPSFTGLKSQHCSTDQGYDLHHTKKTGQIASYDGNPQSWTTAHGMNNDVQKLMRLLRKLPDRVSSFYQEVNRFRDYAVLLGMTEFLKEFAQVLKTECEGMNDTAVKHGRYVAMWFEKDIHFDSYTEVAILH